MKRIQEFLKEKFLIERIPCYYWLLSLLKLVRPESLNNCLKKWAEVYLPEDWRGITLAVDGKAMRSTETMQRYDSPLHIITHLNLNSLRKFFLNLIKLYKSTLLLKWFFLKLCSIVCLTPDVFYLLLTKINFRASILTI